MTNPLPTTELHSESTKLLALLMEWLLDRGGRDGDGRGEFVVQSPHGELRLSVYGLTVLVSKDTSDTIKSVSGRSASEVFEKVASVVDAKEW